MSADIHALEIEFAKDPSLDACIPLCEAYLAQKRFMEAMVVCKKGMKSAPQDPRGRLMLTQVYFEQGKMPKAAAELKALLAQQPGNARALEWMGRVLLEQGDKAGAITQLQVAIQTDPSLTVAAELLAQFGAPVPAAAVPVSAPPQAQPVIPPGNFPPQTAPVMQGPPGVAMPGAVTSGGVPPAASGAPSPAQPAQVAPSAAVPPGIPNQAPIAAPPANHQSPVAAGQPVGGQSGAEDPFDVAGTWADANGEKKLEHVSDFFAPDTLGFSNDGSHIETAGPGRLTILGFVPKSSGSIKTTLLVSCVMFVVAVVVIAYQIYWSDVTNQKNEIFGKVRTALGDDTYYRYGDALKGVEAIKALDSSDVFGLSAEAYIQAALAMDHGEEGALEKAKAVLPEIKRAENEYSVSASAMVAYLEGRYEEGVAELAEILDRGGNHVLIHLENYRLRSKLKPDDDATKSAFRPLLDLSSSDPRALSYLGWHYYGEDDYSRADSRFDAALRLSKNHTRSLIGVTLVDLDRGIGLDERQKELEKNIKKVFALPPEELSIRDRALAYFARAQLRQWQKRTKEAQADFEKAYEIDPNNPLFDFRRGMQLLKQSDAKQAVVFLKKAAAKDPENVSAIKALLKAQLKSGGYEAALATLERAKELAADDRSLVLLQADIARRRREFADAKKLYESINKDDGVNLQAEAYIGVSSVYRASGDAAKAASYMRGKLKEAPTALGKRTEARMWEEMGLGLIATKDKKNAEQAFTVCIDTYSQYANCHCRLATVLGRGAKASQAARACLRVDPRGELIDDRIRRLAR